MPRSYSHESGGRCHARPGSRGPRGPGRRSRRPKTGYNGCSRPFLRFCEATSRRAPPATRRTATSRTASSLATEQRPATERSDAANDDPAREGAERHPRRQAHGRRLPAGAASRCGRTRRVLALRRAVGVRWRAPDDAAGVSSATTGSARRLRHGLRLPARRPPRQNRYAHLARQVGDRRRKHPTDDGEVLSNDNATHTRQHAKRSTGTGAAAGKSGAPDHDA